MTAVRHTCRRVCSLDVHGTNPPGIQQDSFSNPHRPLSHNIACVDRPLHPSPHLCGGNERCGRTEKAGREWCLFCVGRARGMGGFRRSDAFSERLVMTLALLFMFSINPAGSNEGLQPVKVTRSPRNDPVYFNLMGFHGEASSCSKDPSDCEGDGRRRPRGGSRVCVEVRGRMLCSSSSSAEELVLEEHGQRRTIKTTRTTPRGGKYSVEGVSLVGAEGLESSSPIQHPLTQTFFRDFPNRAFFGKFSGSVEDRFEGWGNAKTLSWDGVGLMALRGGGKEDVQQMRREERAMKKKKDDKRPDIEKHPWKYQKDGIPAKYEVRKMTKEGTHVLQIGKKQGYYKDLKTDKQEQEEMEWRNGLDRREKGLALLSKLAVDTSPEASYEIMRYGGRDALNQIIRKRKNELIKYKDAMFGTSVWKEMTAHTVPHGLRHLDDFTKGKDDKMLYVKLNELRKVIFEPHKATTATQKELLEFMRFFAHFGMMWEIQMGLLKLHGVKALMYLGFVGGGHHMLRRPNGKHPFGNKLSEGKKRKKDPELAQEGCKMLVAISRNSPWICAKLVKMDIMIHSVHLGLIFSKDSSTLCQVLIALQHFARLKGKPMGPRKLEVIKSGGLELLIKALRNHPLDFRVKRYALEAAEILVTGIGDWKEEARQIIRDAKVTDLAELGLDKLSHFVGSRLQARKALLNLYVKVHGREAAQSYVPGTPGQAPAPLTQQEVVGLAKQGRLPQPFVSKKLAGQCKTRDQLNRTRDMRLPQPFVSKKLAATLSQRQSESGGRGSVARKKKHSKVRFGAPWSAEDVDEILRSRGAALSRASQEQARASQEQARDKRDALSRDKKAAREKTRDQLNRTRDMSQRGREERDVLNEISFVAEESESKSPTGTHDISQQEHESHGLSAEERQDGGEFSSSAGGGAAHEGAPENSVVVDSNQSAAPDDDAA